MRWHPIVLSPKLGVTSGTVTSSHRREWASIEMRTSLPAHPLFPNSIFDPETARDLWQMFLREHEYASEVGFDGSVCNEHHKGPGRGRGELGGACPRSRWWRAALNVQLLVYPRQRSP